MNALGTLSQNITSRNRQTVGVFYEGKLRTCFNYHCSCIRTSKGTILGIAFSDEFKHAEVNAIEKIKKKYTKKQLIQYCKKEGGFVLEVVRFNNKRLGFKKSNPCKECQKRINLCFGIVKVLHS